MSILYDDTSLVKLLDAADDNTVGDAYNRSLFTTHTLHCISGAALIEVSLDGVNWKTLDADLAVGEHHHETGSAWAYFRATATAADPTNTTVLMRSTGDTTV